MEKEINNISIINDKYEIIDQKGNGSSGTVFLAENKNNKNKYAIKIFKNKESDFKNEISILEKISAINCPYIINLIEYGEGLVKINSKEESKQYIVLDYASKGELFDYIYSSQKGLNEKYAKLIFGKILRGVQTLHKSGICHRDLKMQNILLDDSFNPKICDFGFATDISGEDGSGKLNKFLGTVNYAAPEIFLRLPYDGIKVDIFSLGVILFNLVTKKLGFIRAYKNDPYYIYIMRKNYKTYWEKISKEIGEISDELKDLFLKMVSFNPEERPNIDEILNHSWMKETEDLNKDEYKIVENEVFKEFKILESKM